jgi:23S rRNA-/tRNA-specific pseudouridylate synthase
LVAVQIFTWRFHQIRNHLSHIWFPILGDKLYWDEALNKELKSKYKIDRQLLHSLYYWFDDINSKYIYKISNYPAEFAKLFDSKYIWSYLEKLKNL